ncbi:NlpC/P60 family protein [Xinfangfangia sp. CPCC 101601]|uniref:NlpC/P60 family protein n=1 Tax=Pseudogemmobacter lacusdianii TaxID=3069608 RepID=A0ABU0W102_9RHOB|nr:NlpC/P60 family protein [Xinfangfangia sp. CPCC 101601]MDQ2067691.1 NlpC/P60 family protein [Xinfangfangia sp. CPCC 101601]
MKRCKALPLTLPERAVQEARLWLGTPYVHQASCRGAGADCLGLLRGIWRGLYGLEPESVPAYTQDWAEPGGEEVLLWAGQRLLQQKTLGDAQRGDVILFRMRQGRIAKHLGLQTETGPQPQFIHAYSGHGVIENPLTEPWRRRIAARFAFPIGAR